MMSPAVDKLLEVAEEDVLDAPARLASASRARREADFIIDAKLLLAGEDVDFAFLYNGSLKQKRYKLMPYSFLAPRDYKILARPC